MLSVARTHAARGHSGGVTPEVTHSGPGPETHQSRGRLIKGGQRPFTNCELRIKVTFNKAYQLINFILFFCLFVFFCFFLLLLLFFCLFLRFQLDISPVTLR